MAAIIGSRFGKCFTAMVFHMTEHFLQYFDRLYNFRVSQEEKRVTSVENGTLNLDYNYSDLIDTDTCAYIYGFILVGILITATVR